jgi:plasmid stabilization system protein ParE
MTMIVRKRARAYMDLDEQAEYIGRSSPQTALRFLDAFDATVASLASMPGLGSPLEFAHPDLQGLRAWSVSGFKNHFIIFRVHPDCIEILRVLRGTRDLEATLGADRC